MTAQQEAAVDYAGRLGLPIFPLHEIVDGRCGCGQSDCKAIGKHPIVKGWQNSIASVAAAEASWGGALGARGIGLVCGPRAGLFGLDVDRRHGGEQTVRDWKRRGMKLAKTATDRTGDGWHLLYRWPEGVEIRAQHVGAGVQCRGVAHFLVLAPSMHKSGRRYEWVRPLDEVASPDDWLLEQIVANSKRKAPIVDADDDDGYLIPGGQRYDHLIRFAGLIRSCGVNETTLVECGLAFLRHQCESEPEMDFEYAEAQLRKVWREWKGTYTRREER